MAMIDGGSQVVPVEILHQLGGDEVAGRKFTHRRAVVIDVDEWIDQQLKRQRRSGAVAQLERRDRGEIGARTLTTDGDLTRVDAELAGLLDHESGRRNG